jgi:nucleoside phosphorylase
MIAILAALETELRGLRRHLRGGHTSKHRGMTITEGYLPGKLSRLPVYGAPAFRGRERHLYAGGGAGTEVVLIAMGMGRACAEPAADYALAHYKPAALVTAGFAGAVVRNLRAGDVVICARQYGLRRWPSDPLAERVTGGAERAERLLEGPISSDRHLVALWEKAAPVLQRQRVGRRRPNVVIGATLTVPELVTGRQMKEWLGLQFAVVVVDMESYWVAQRAAEQQVPFVNVRAVSDTFEQQLPALAGLVDAHGRPQGRAMGAYLLRHPRHIDDLCLLGIRSQRAVHALTRALLAVAAG